MSVEQHISPTFDSAHDLGLDAEKIRRDFPIFSQTVYGKPLTFLDSAASAQKPACVINKESEVYETTYANVHRGVYKFSQDATEAYENTRLKVQGFINAASHKECIFVRGATEGINLVAQSWGRSMVKSGDEIILSTIEHHSNIVPWQMLAAEKGAVIKVIPVDESGTLDMRAYQNLLSDKTKLVAVGHISNSIGTINPVKEIIALAHNAGAVCLIDGCQAAPHTKIDVQDLDADFYVFSAHKMYGPTGIGVVYGKQALLDAMPPWQGGGDMINTVSFDGTTWNDLPYKFEAGTPNIAAGIALGSAIDYINAIGFNAIEAHETQLYDYAIAKMRGLNSVKLIGTSPNKAAIISFVMECAHPHDIGTILDRQGIAVRAGHHCAQPAMDFFQIPGTVRASFGLYNTRDDVDRFIEGLEKVLDLFG